MTNPESLRHAATTRRITTAQGSATQITIPGLRCDVVGGPSPRKSWFLTHDTARIGGAEDNDIVLQDGTVSRHHAVVKKSPEGFLVQDLGSKNGTFAGEVRVKEIFVEPGNEVRLGQTTLRFSSVSENFVALAVPRDQYHSMLGTSNAMREIYTLIEAVAPSTANILIEGESGTGKELVAKAIHLASGRSGPLVIVDCANVTRELIRSELFGHRRGAFTGADADRSGAFRRAHAGTLFLDELGELDEALQPSLLRALESREVTPVGSDETIPVDVRFLGATHRPLRAYVAAGKFRSDLYHRLNIVSIKLPPLRDRRDDIPLLVDHFCRQMPVRFGSAAIGVLMTHSWPGNVRELRNAVERMSLLVRGREVLPGDLAFLEGDGAPAGPGVGTAPPGPRDAIMDGVERATLLRVLDQHGGNKTEAARVLGISLSTLKRRLRQYRGEDDV